jgi:altronate hydrolase
MSPSSLLPPSTRRRALLLRPGDSVAVATESLPSGEVLEIGGTEVRLSQAVPGGHKIALLRVEEGEPVHKYGQVIGFATRTIEPGEHVHTHNLAVGELALTYEFSTQVTPPALVRDAERRTFEGFRRADGRVGTRNYVAVISTVNCSASVSRYVAERFRGDALQTYPNVDGVVALTHKLGCGMNIAGPETRMLQRTLAGFARHANVAGYLICGLGCEVNQAAHLIENEGLLSLDGGRPPTVIGIQDHGGITKAVEAGVEAVARMLPPANECRRTPQPASELIVATNCGGSDAYSGITANPTVGWLSDELVRQGGTSVLAETTETYGAEHLLTRRAVSREVGEKLLALMRWWEQYTASHGAEIDNNPAPGNKAGGLTTIYEKSLGAVAKGGTAPLVDVYQYAEPVTAKGFVFMDTPGHDPVSITGLVAGGANVVVFTTGRGSVYGCKPTPSIKVATNTRLYEHMNDDMDFNAGIVLEGVSVEDAGHALFEKVLAVASGEKTKSELHGMGDEEFNPWMIGPTL